ncbi:MAG: hypothetical protein K8S16_14520, partial [Bacteroidales bacterium]|nr:hypothetical protein [Bacteroidales bacterium]
MKMNYQFLKFTISVILFLVIAIPTIGQKSKKDIVDKSVNYMEIGPDCKSDPIPSDAQFDLQFEYPVVGGGQQTGIETDGNYIYTTEWNNTNFHKYGIDGTYVDAFNIAGVSNIRDMAYDGTYFYGSNASTTVYIMDFTSQSLISSFTAPTQCRAIAYNEDDDAFYANNWGSDITKFDKTGSYLVSWSVGPVGDSYYGFAYDNYSTGGPYLWGYAQIGATSNELIQMELPLGNETGVYFDVGSVINTQNSLAGGIAIDNNLIPGYWTILGLCQLTSIWGLELCPSGTQPINDIGVMAIVEPSSGVNITASEPVTVTIKNYGTAAQSNFEVSFTLDTGTPVIETITATINGGNTYDHTFATTVDLSVYGTYTFEACTDLVGDEIPGNDCKIKTVENIEPSYCSTSYSNQTDDWISNVTFNTINNSTVAEPGGYGDYISEITSVEQNLSYDLSADVTVNGSWIQHTWAWIDWNQNYDFTDPGEAYDLGETPGTAGTFTLTANITVPGDALPGLTRMRVAELYNADPEPCSVDVYGEAEDYSVEVIYNTNSSFDLKLFLEGPFLYNQMIPYLNLLGYIPLVQPYNTEPWNYGSNESVGAIPNLDVVDWVLVELRKTTGDVTTATADSTIDMKAGFLLKDGSIVGLDGVNPIQLNTLPSGDMYVVIWHRNHLGVISNFPLIETKGVYSYDFTTAANQAYGDSFVMKELNTGIWGVMSGDGLNDTKINNEDKNEVWVPQDDNYGYYEGDFNLDGQVNDPDKVVYWEPNSGKSGMVPGGPRTNWVGEFTCGDVLIDSRDGQSYTTVQIGTQCWMAENLNIGTRIDGVNEMTDNGTIEKYCYDNVEDSCDVYGGLYQWDEMMQYVTIEGTQGICPTDWHLPTDDEWKVLEGTVDSQYGVGDPEWNGGAWRGFDAGKNLKSSSGWINNGNGTNSFGLDILPAGGRGVNGTFIQLGNLVTYSTSTFSWDRQLKSDQEGIWRGHGPDIYGNPVRCIRDESTQINQPPSQPSNPSPVNGAIDQMVNTTLSWTCTDPESDPLTYDVYFGETNPPSVVSSGQTANTYNPGTLNYNITYYWKITAHDDHTNSTEGPVWSITTVALTWQCGDVLIDTRDGQSYNTVQIGTQCWMAENLNIGTRIDGVNEMTDNSTIEKYCYDDLETNCDTYGGLYQWDEMMQYTTTPGVQGICPTGWHLPTDNEWCTLENGVDAGTVSCTAIGWRGIDAGGNLKEIGTTHWNSPNTGATNS